MKRILGVIASILFVLQWLVGAAHWIWTIRLGVDYHGFLGAVGVVFLPGISNIYFFIRTLLDRGWYAYHTLGAVVVGTFLIVVVIGAFAEE